MSLGPVFFLCLRGEGVSLLKSEDAKKWINFFVAIVSSIGGFVAISLLGEVGEWFDLEAKLAYYEGISQGVGILAGLAIFLYLTRAKKSSTHMQEVYDELLKVVWPTRDVVVKVTVCIVIGVAILSSIFVAVDYLFNQLLNLVY